MAVSRWLGLFLKFTQACYNNRRRSSGKQLAVRHANVRMECDLSSSTSVDLSSLITALYIVDN